MGRFDRSSLLLLFFSVFICLDSYWLKLGTPSSPGPGFFSFGAGLILGVLSLIEFFKSSVEKHEQKKIERGEKYKIVLVLAALAAYGLVLEWIGFLLSTFTLLIFLLRVIVPQRWTRVLVTAFLSSLCSYLLFEVWLKAQLPRGFLGF